MRHILLPNLITPENYERNVLFELDQRGRISSRKCDVDLDALPTETTVLPEASVALAGLVNAHSHAFQRLLRGPTQYRGPNEDSFWTWRKVMYAGLKQLSPEDLYIISKHIYLEMVASGTTHVGEFHYVHHQPNGAPYSDSIRTSKAIIAAAKDAGIKLTLLRTIYMRGDFDAEPEPQQRRFIDKNLNEVHQSLESLFALEEHHISVGLAPHSVRAVSPQDLRELKERYPKRPFHIHTSEQPRENDGCHQYYGMSPVALLEANGCLDPKTVLVHATHVSPADIELIAKRKSQVCFCPSTEADLGDGIGPAREYIQAGVPLSLGTDGQTFSSILEEARRLEMHERLRLQMRNALPLQESKSSGSICLEIATSGGGRALGTAGQPLEVGQPLDFFTIDRNDPFIAGVTDHDLLNAILFSLPSSRILSTYVDGKMVFDHQNSQSLEASGRELQALRSRLSF